MDSWTTAGVDKMQVHHYVVTVACLLSLLAPKACNVGRSVGRGQRRFRITAKAGKPRESPASKGSVQA